MPPPNAFNRELRKMWDKIDENSKYIRSLRTWQQRVGSGNNLKGGAIVGAVPTTSGGSGTDGVAGSVITLVNGTGGTVNEGDVLLINDGATAISTTGEGDLGPVGVVIDTSVTAGNNVRLRVQGWVRKLKVSSTAAVDDQMRVSASTNEAEATGIPTAPTPGVFAVATSTDTAGFCAAFLMGFTLRRHDQRQLLATPVLPSLGTFTPKQLADVSTGYVGQVPMPMPMFAPYTMSYDVTTPAVGAGCVIRGALFTADGIKVADGTDAVGTASGLRTFTLTPTDTLVHSEDLLYLYISLAAAAATTQPFVRFWDTDNTFNAVATFATLCGTIVITAGAAPAAFNPSADITAVANCTPYARISSY